MWHVTADNLYKQITNSCHHSSTNQSCVSQYCRCQVKSMCSDGGLRGCLCLKWYPIPYRGSGESSALIWWCRVSCWVEVCQTLAVTEACHCNLSNQSHHGVQRSPIPFLDDWQNTEISDTFLKLQSRVGVNSFSMKSIQEVNWHSNSNLPQCLAMRHF
jgi:hypothetical protein